MPKNLKNIDSDAATGSSSTGGVQVKSVSAKGNIKISLKAAPQQNTSDTLPELRAVQSEKQPLSEEQKPTQSTSQTPKDVPAQAKKKAQNIVPTTAKPAVKTQPAAKAQKQQAAATSKLASASAQGAANLPNPTASRSSLKPLGLAAAVLGTVALSLGVMQFAGGSDTPEVAADAQPENSVSVATPNTTEVVLAEVDADKAAIVAPVQASVADVDGDVTAEAIAAAVAKLAPSETFSEPVKAENTTSGDILETATFASASLFKASPKEVWEQERSDADRIEPASPKTVSAPHVSTAKKLALVSYLSALPDGPEAQQQASALTQKMTSGTLAALSKPKAAPVEADPVYIFDLVVDSLADGLSEAELDQLINEAHAAGRVTVPSSLILADGSVDSKTILALFAGK